MHRISCIELSSQQKQWLLALARKSIIYGLKNQGLIKLKAEDIPAEFSPVFNKVASCFVTLYEIDHKGYEQLRGCIGSLQAYQTLLQDVIEHAFAAAFSDSRFPPVNSKELERLVIQISILGPAETINCDSEIELIQQLVPYEDGLILDDGFNRGTFLPSVWQQLPSKEQFVAHLKAKAGMNVKGWNEQTKAYRYKTISFAESH